MTEDSPAAIIPGPPPPRYHNSAWKLISQGAEARVWIVPNYIQYSTTISKENNECSSTSLTSTTRSIGNTVICKERFPKSYRHPSLDESLTKARTKAEAKSLARCRRGGVPVPLVLGIDLNKKQQRDSRQSACLFMEKVHGCTLRSFLNANVKVKGVDANVEAENENQNKTGSTVEAERPYKKAKVNDDGSITTETKAKASPEKKISTRLDEYSKKVAHMTGVVIGQMHNANIIHGDLTTSNILLRNPVDLDDCENGIDTKINDKNNNSNGNGKCVNDWTPDVVLIDFGLSSSSAGASSKKSSTSSQEERAVDLYVLERAFLTTHAGSEELVDEVMRGYKGMCQSSDAVFQRLSQVRARGRKRECFG